MEFSLNVNGFDEKISYKNIDVKELFHNGIKENLVKYEYVFGTVEFREICLDIGSVLISNYHFKIEGLRLYNSLKGEMVEMHFNLGNTIEMGKNFKDSLFMKPMTYNLLGLKNVDGFVNFGKGKLFRTFDVHFNDKFLNKIKEFPKIKEFLNCYNDENTAVLYPEGLPISNEMKDIINKIINCDLPKHLHKDYIESKVLELFCLHLVPSVNKTIQHCKFSDEQIRKINKVKAYIEKNLKRSVSVKELVDKFDIKEYKLKQGFTILFGTSVFNYSMEYRMKYACKLIEQGNSIDKVYPLVGYANHSSFSKAFKTCLGFSPLSVKRSNML